MNIRDYVFVHACLSSRLLTSICLSVFLSINRSISVLFMSLCLSVSLSIYIYMCVCVCVYAYTCVYEYMWKCVQPCICISMNGTI